MEKIIKYGLFVLMLGAIFTPHYYLPYLQKKIESIQVSKLNGSYDDTQKPNFWLRTWQEGSFQKAYDKYLRDRNEIAPFMIRFKSQIDYSVFNDISHENIIPGKNNYLYAKTDCDAYIGKNYKGKNWIEEQTRKLKAIIDFYEAKGVSFLVLSPPSKTSVIPENLPDFYAKYPIDSTNRMGFSAAFKEYEIPVIDFEYLKEVADTSTYPIYPQAGLHWTQYGLTVASDSIRKYIAKTLDVKMVNMNWQDSILLKSQLENSDNELIQSSNFLLTPELANLAYPQITYTSDSTTTRPKVLAMGDSFYLLLYEYGIHKNLFNQGSMFWYYYNELYPGRVKDGKKIHPGELDLLETIAANEMIIICVYEQNLERFAFSFVDKLYNKIQEQ